MEHLSAEERACLMYLEETIEALEVQEVQEDSGLSNDEPDPLLQADKMGQMTVNGTLVLHVFLVGRVVAIQIPVLQMPPILPKIWYLVSVST